MAYRSLPGPKGDKGDQGPPGDITWLSAWSAQTEYAKDNAVESGGSAWVALRTNTGATPVEGDDWTLMAAKGGDGADGADGVGFTHKNFSSQTEYEVNDVVEWSGASYICVSGYTTGSDPTGPDVDETHWETLAQKGDKGDTGDSDIDLTNLPTSDPAVAGAPWNDSGTLKFSTGT